MTKSTYRTIPLAHVEKKPESSQKWTRAVISPTASAATDAASDDLRIQEQVAGSPSSACGVYQFCRIMDIMLNLERTNQI